MSLPGFDDEDDTPYPTSANRIHMMRALALGLALLMLIFLVFALAI